MESTINSLTDFRKLKKKFKYFNLISEEDINKRLQFNKPLVLDITEKETGETVLTLKLDKQIKDLITELSTIRKRLTKYTKEMFLAGKNRIEQLRQKMVKVKEIVGPEWHQDKVYEINRYIPLREFLFEELSIKDMVKWIINNKDIVAEKYTKYSISFGEKLILTLYKVLLQMDEDPSSYNFKNIISVCLNELSYKKIIFDFKLLSKINMALVEEDIYLSDKEYIIKNLTCFSLGRDMMGGSLQLYNSTINSLLFNAKNLKKVITKNCETFEKPLKNAVNIKYVDIKGLKIIMNISKSKVKKRTKAQELEKLHNERLYLSDKKRKEILRLALETSTMNNNSVTIG